MNNDLVAAARNAQQFSADAFRVAGALDGYGIAGVQIVALQQAIATGQPHFTAVNDGVRRSADLADLGDVRKYSRYDADGTVTDVTAQGEKPARDSKVAKLLGTLTDPAEMAKLAQIAR